MASSLENYLSNIYSTLDELDEVGLGIANFKPEIEVQKSRELLQSDLGMFLFYLSASDNEISVYEKNFIEKYLGLPFSMDEIKSIIREKHVRSIEFEDSIPLSVQMMVEADNAIVKAGTPDSTGNVLLYGVFKILGQAFIASDNEVDEKESRDLGNYLLKIKNYINDMSLSSCKVVTDPFTDAKASRNLLTQYRAELVSFDSDSDPRKKFDSKKEPAPWDIVYMEHACPYCGKKKVRYAKWDDKMFSTAFWGFYSYKLHCSFKCDECGKMWN